MKDRTGQNLVPIAFCAIGVLALCFQGCEKSAPSSAPVAPTAAACVEDPTFMEGLAERREARADLVAVHARLARQMRKRVDEKLKELGVDRPTEADLARVKAELEKDPEWNSLYARCKDAAEAVSENQRDAMREVRRRMISACKSVRSDGKKISK